MYSVFINGELLYNDMTLSQNGKVSKPKLTIEDNSSGSFTCSIPITNFQYNEVQPLTSRVEVYKHQDIIWAGRIIQVDTDFWKNKTITCEGDLSFLIDSIQPPHEFRGTVDGFLRYLISVHNSKVDASKQFSIGRITVSDPNNYILRYTNYETTLDCINDKLIDKLGGHMRVRYWNGVRYLDYLADYETECLQTIEFGKNLSEFSKNLEVTDFATVLVPKGARLNNGSDIEALEAYVDVSSVNGGSIYVENTAAIKAYGRIEKVVEWDDVTEPANLLTKARLYLRDLQYGKVTLEVTAVDLHYINRGIESFGLLEKVHVISEPHGMDRYFPVTKIVINLDQPESSLYTLGTDSKENLTAASNKLNVSLNEKIDNKATIAEIRKYSLEEAQAEATRQITNATEGYITITKTDTGSEELFITNTKNYKNATKVWRWNLNGLGYSKNGLYGPYGIAITQNGEIVADYITTGTMAADRIKGGELAVGGSREVKGNGSIVVYNSSNSAIVTLNQNGISISKGSINIGNGRFVVDSNGNLTASNVSLSGNITATSGRIGNWWISGGSLIGADIGLDADNQSSHAIWAGNSNQWDAPFKVGHNGHLYASSVDITGSGSIGGNLVTAGINANNITAGTISASRIDCQGVVDAAWLNADNINAGTISTDRLRRNSVGSIEMGNTEWGHLWISQAGSITWNGDGGLRLGVPAHSIYSSGYVVKQAYWHYNSSDYCWYLCGDGN